MDVVFPLIETDSSSGLHVIAPKPWTPGITILAPSSSADLEQEAARLRIQDIPEPTRDDADPSLSLSFNLEPRKSKAARNKHEYDCPTIRPGNPRAMNELHPAIMTGQLNQAKGIKVETPEHFQEVKVDTNSLGP